MAGATLALHLSAAAPTNHLALQNIVCRLPLRHHIVCPGLECLLNGIERACIDLGVNLNGRKEVLGCG